MKNNNKVEAVIFDLSGTLVDHGSLATIQTMKQVFIEKKISLTNEIIKLNMGINKKEHIKKILLHPLIIKKWIKNYKKKFTIKDLNDLSIKFDNLLISTVKKNLNLVPNVKKIFGILKKKKIKIGATTGYPSKITKIIISFLKQNNLFLDYCVSENQVKRGRPYPDMCLKNLKYFKIKNPHHCLKIDDSFAGILEGKKARVKTVGLITTGIQTGLTHKKFLELNKKKKIFLIKKIKKNFLKINTDFIIKDLFEFESLLEKLT